MNNKQEFITLIETSVQLPCYSGEAILIWIGVNDIDLFTTLIGDNYFCEGDVDVTLMGDYICFDGKDLLGYMEIEESELDITRGSR